MVRDSSGGGGGDGARIAARLCEPTTAIGGRTKVAAVAVMVVVMEVEIVVE